VVCRHKVHQALVNGLTLLGRQLLILVCSTLSALIGLLILVHRHRINKKFYQNKEAPCSVGQYDQHSRDGTGLCCEACMVIHYVDII
jgi:hypothetical protein